VFFSLYVFIFFSGAIVISYVCFFVILVFLIYLGENTSVWAVQTDEHKCASCIHVNQVFLVLLINNFINVIYYRTVYKS
jgi:hypothetical protein